MTRTRGGAVERSERGGVRKGVRALAIVLPLLTLIALLSACTFDGPTMTINPDFSVENRELWSLYALVWWLAVAVFVVVEIMLFYVIFRFRRHPGQGLPKQVHGNNRLEIGWTIIPAVLLVIIAVPTVRTLIAEARPAPADAVRIKVIAHQFWWEVRYPDATDPTNRDKDIVTANEIHIPLGKTAEFELTSADVQHSFWVPLLGGKMDVLPNRTNYLKYTPEKVGQYYGQCAELCGTAHGFMKMYVFVDDAATYQAWYGAQKQPASPVVAAGEDPKQVEAGKKLVTGGACATCHAIAGTNLKARVGPDLTHFGSRTTFSSAWVPVTVENVKTWVRNPDLIKPGVTHLANEQIASTGQLYSRMPAFPNYTDEELTQIAKYLISLK